MVSATSEFLILGQTITVSQNNWQGSSLAGDNDHCEGWPGHYLVMTDISISVDGGDIISRYRLGIGITSPAGECSAVEYRQSCGPVTARPS